MAKKRGGKKGGGPTLGCASLREESGGIKQVNAASMLKLEHLRNLAVWAGGEGAVPPLAAFFGKRLADTAEAAGVPLDRSLFVCHKCETVLQPGDNCTVRIEKKAELRHCKRSNTPLQNNVIYTCNFCSHRNAMMGTAKGHLKDLLISRGRNGRKKDSYDVATYSGKDKDIPANSKLTSEVMKGMVSLRENPLIPRTMLSDKKRKIDGTGSNKVAAVGTPAVGGSSKRKRKGWSSLKDIVQSNERAKQCRISNLVIPFKL